MLWGNAPAALGAPSAERAEARKPRRKSSAADSGWSDDEDEDDEDDGGVVVRRRIDASAKHQCFL